jgi:hypothetical protein
MSEGFSRPFLRDLPGLRVPSVRCRNVPVMRPLRRAVLVNTCLSVLCVLRASVLRSRTFLAEILASRVRTCWGPNMIA